MKKNAAAAALAILFVVNFMAPSRGLALSCAGIGALLLASQRRFLAGGLALGFALLVFLSVSFAGDWGQGLATGLRVASQSVLLLGLAGFYAREDLMGAARRGSAPAWLLQLMDEMVLQGRLLAQEWERALNAVQLRLAGRERPSLAVYGNLMAAGSARSFDRFLRLDQARQLRGAQPLVLRPGPLLAAENLSVETGRVQILRQISFGLNSGEWVAVLGASGCGKSTLLEVLAGLRPFTGEVRRFGGPVHGKAIRDRVSSEVQLLFQDPNEQILGPTPREDLLYLARPGLTEVMAKEALGAVGLGHRVDSPSWELSFGEKKRLALAGILLKQPRLLLCDEPTAGLDPVNIRALVQALSAASFLEGVLWVTHDYHHIPAAVRRVILMHEGKILFDGPRAEALSPQMLSRANLWHQGGPS